MSKRKVKFAEPPNVESDNSQEKRKKRHELKKGKLDTISDVDYNDDLGESGSEADEAGDANILNMDEVEVEEKTVEYDQETKITPFNLDEEMEEGHFDRDGTFVFSKESTIKDSWLDDVDFNNVKQMEFARLAEEKKRSKQEEESDDAGDEKLTNTQIFSQILTFLCPGENVLKAVRRLGNASKSLSASERLKLKKQAAKDPALISSSSANIEEQKKQLMRLTELADLLIRRGQMNAYEETFESLNYQVSRSVEQTTASASQRAPASDIFSDDFDDNAVSAAANSAKKDEKSDETSDVVKWEYKIGNENETAIHGPLLTADLMNTLSDEKEAESPRSIYVRRHGSAGQFYSSNRVDFSLYID